MSGAQEYGTCDICGNKQPINRKYYRYPIKCECCNGPEDDHFEICFYCDDCAPRPPRIVKCFLQPIKNNMIVTFFCQKTIHVYEKNSLVRPMPPYKTHKSIEDAKSYLFLSKGITEPQIIHES